MRSLLVMGYSIYYRCECVERMRMRICQLGTVPAIISPYAHCHCTDFTHYHAHIHTHRRAQFVSPWLQAAAVHLSSVIVAVAMDIRWR